jgi:hypothetical protein
VGPIVEYGFAAAFAPVRRVRLESRPGGRIPAAGEIAGTASGHFWWVDPAGCDVKIYGPDGRLGHVLRGGGGLADLCAPASVTAFHGSWVAVLDAGLGRVQLYDARARRQGGFDLPHLDEPRQIRNLGDRHLAIIGPGSGRAADRWVHLYRPDGRHIESVFAFSRRQRSVLAPAAPPAPAPPGAPVGPEAAPNGDALQSAAAGASLWLAYGPHGAVVLYDFSSRLVHSFALEPEARGEPPCGVFATSAERAVVMYREPETGRYAYDLYAPTGERILGPVRSAQRLVGVEGPLFYSIDSGKERESDATLRICRLRNLGA